MIYMIKHKMSVNGKNRRSAIWYEGHHDIYCSCLSEERIKLRNNLEKLLKVKCFELDNISGNFAHDDCFFVGLYCTKEFCKTKCEYYQENLAALFQEIDELAEAEKVLTEASERGLV